jgi:hypothetical protein
VGGPSDAGTLFELSGPDFRTVSTFYSLGLNDAMDPNTRLIADRSGTLFDNTVAGLFYYGAVFELSGPAHHTFSVLTRFESGQDGGFWSAD